MSTLSIGADPDLFWVGYRYGVPPATNTIALEIPKIISVSVFLVEVCEGVLNISTGGSRLA